jgi:hypothetical protein
VVKIFNGDFIPSSRTSNELLPYDDAHILSATRQFLKTVNGTLHIPALHLTLHFPFREHGQCLMEVCSTLPGATRAKLEATNHVRIFYGVAYISELTTADGKSIARDAWEGHRPCIWPLLWPFQPPLGRSLFMRGDVSSSMHSFVALISTLVLILGIYSFTPLLVSGSLRQWLSAISGVPSTLRI